MKTIEIKLYKFSELSEEAKERVLIDHYDINLFPEWWDSVYDDAAQIGLRITGFDLDYKSITGEFIESAPETAEAILTNHGQMCETYKTAKTFLNDLDALTGKYPNIEDCPEDEIESLEDDFLHSILGDYRIILKNEYDYLTGKEAIIETIEANEYDFTEDGKIY
jgi:hypothetical protein